MKEIVGFIVECAPGPITRPTGVVISVVDMPEYEPLLISMDQARRLRNQLNGLLNSCDGRARREDEKRQLTIDLTSDGTVTGEYLRPRTKT